MRAAVLLAALLLARAAAMQIDGVRLIDSGDPSRAAGARLALRHMRMLSDDVATCPGVRRDSMDGASLLNRLLYEHGERLTGLQLLNPQALAAYEAHVGVWRQVPVNATWVVLEDDALVQEDTILGLRELLASLVEEVHYINLRPLHRARGAVPSNASRLLGECPLRDRACHNLGQVAYLVTHEGARRLLQHALPADVPVDWYTDSFRAFFDPGFRHTFSLRRLFGHGGGVSLINHRCLTCEFPRTNSQLQAFLTVSALSLVLVALLQIRFCRAATRRRRNSAQTIHV